MLEHNEYLPYYKSRIVYNGELYLCCCCCRNAITTLMDCFDCHQTSRKASRALYNKKDFTETDFYATDLDGHAYALSRHARIRGKERGLSEKQMIRGNGASGAKTRTLKEDARRKMVTTYIPTGWKANAGEYHMRAELEHEIQAADGRYHFRYIMVPSYAKHKMRKYTAPYTTGVYNDSSQWDTWFECNWSYGGKAFMIKGLDVAQVQAVYDEAQAVVNEARTNEERRRKKVKRAEAMHKARAVERAQEEKEKAEYLAEMKKDEIAAEEKAAEAAEKARVNAKIEKCRIKAKRIEADVKLSEHAIKLARMELNETDSNAKRQSLLGRIRKEERRLHNLIWN